MKPRRSSPPAVLSALLVFASAAFAPAAAQRPNIIFVIGDDMDRFMFNCLLDLGDADALAGRVAKGFDGKRVLSPNLDRLASQGMVFPNQHVVSSVCTPSRYAVLTGRVGSRGTNITWDRYGGMRYPYFNMEIQPANTTLAGLLRSAGYRTGFVGKDHVHDNLAYDNSIPSGADPDDPATRARLEANVDGAEAAIRSCGFDFAASVYPKNPAELPDPLAVHNMDWIARGGVDFIEECVTGHPGQPFFLYFSTTLTHAPNDAPRAWQADPRATPRGFVDFASPLPDRSTIPARMASAGLPIGRLDHLLWFDDALGALFGKLEEHGLAGNTVVVLFDDHGVEPGGKSGLYQGGSRSLSIAWRAGGFPGGGVSHALLSNIDFAPTLLDLAGVDAPFDHFDGRSFLPLLEGTAPAVRRSCYLELGCARGVVMDGWKYIAVRWPAAISDPVGSNAGWASLNVPLSTLESNVRAGHPHYYDADQLYDLSADPGEQVNLASDPVHARRLELMKRELARHLAPLPGSFGEFKAVVDEWRPGSVIEVR